MIGRELLKRGHSVLLSDVDVVWLSPGILAHVDYTLGNADLACMVDGKEMNGGFYAAKPSPIVMELFQKVADALKADANLIDQYAFANVINRAMKIRYSKQLHFLDKLLYSNGNVYFQERLNEKMGIQPMIVHANFFVGAKKKREMLQSGGDLKAQQGEAKLQPGEAKVQMGDPKPQQGEAKPQSGDRKGKQGEACAQLNGERGRGGSSCLTPESYQNIRRIGIAGIPDASGSRDSRRKRERQLPKWKHIKLSYQEKYHSFASVPAFKSDSLEVLYLNGNKILNVEFDGWETPKLGTLWLTHTLLTAVPAIKSDSLEHVYLYNNSITNVDFSRWATPKLRTLSLTHNLLTSLPAFKSDSLEGLYLYNNSITNVDLSRWATPKLRTLSLTHNLLTSVPAFKCDGLVRLNLDSNKITNVDFDGMETPKLSVLQLQNNMLTTVPAITSDSLEELDLYNNNIINVDFSRCATPKLRTLSLTHNLLTSVPAFKFDSLEYLSLDSNKITNLDVDRRETPKLIVLSLKNNSLTAFPAIKSDSLERLELESNKITNVQFDSRETPKLSSLSLRNNSLTSFPDIKSDSLMHLYLDFNEITSVEFDIWATPKLGLLSLNNNLLTSVPAFRSDRLWHISLNFNKITNVEFDTWATPKLGWLYLNNNLLTSVPTFKSDSLKRVELDFNKITRVVFDRWETPKLRILSLTHNLLTSVPALKSESLEELYLDWNKITNVELDGWTTPKLRKLSLTNNLFTSVPALNDNSLAFRTSVPIFAESSDSWAPTLRLQNNSIATIDGWILHRILKEFSEGGGLLRLEGNPIRCDCSLSWLAVSPELMGKTKGACENGIGLKYPDLMESLKKCHGDATTSPSRTRCLDGVGDRTCIDLPHAFVCDEKTLDTSLACPKETQVCCKKRANVTGCGQLPGIMHGRFSIYSCSSDGRSYKSKRRCIQGGKYLIGSKVNYTCENYYILRGPSVRTCEGTGEWTGEWTGPDPFCEPALKSDSLEELYLDWNKITNVELDGWTTPKLRKLSLTNNLFTSVPALNDNSLAFRTSIPIFAESSGNPVRCDCSLSWLAVSPELMGKMKGACENGIGLKYPDLMESLKKCHGDATTSPSRTRCLDGVGDLTCIDLPHAFVCDEKTLDTSLACPKETQVCCKKRANVTGCGQLPGIIHGRFSIYSCSSDGRSYKSKRRCIQGGKYLIGSKVNYTCENYYILRGPSVRTCGGTGEWNGEWTGPDPFCEPECGRMKKLGASARRLIRDGEEVAFGARPWQVAVCDALRRVVICGGALIGRGWVLTAAHCVEDQGNLFHFRDVNDFFVYLGKHYLNESMDDEFVQKMKVTRIITHDAYNGLESDIALLKLDRSAKPTERVQLICLPSHDDRSDDFLDGAQNECGGSHHGWTEAEGKWTTGCQAEQYLAHSHIAITNATTIGTTTTITTTTTTTTTDPTVAQVDSQLGPEDVSG
ncbi:unnamed protein product [Darwinula stevensoni]|uniref:Uncharacterized protein n=1 Tax=Darwinula stevensoni TaxID=69355 RepID=A0A7R8X9T0_9CRUS|nr:unnamed protein product [Darwinula stevensoni]CAG0884706.1 unnamed protein product [Darwinula stevensoni]